MVSSAGLKLSRAERHIAELEDVIRTERPFRYVLETNTQTLERATYARRNELAVQQVGLIIGDVIHALRCSLDHVYWDRVSPFATNDAERRRIQFPFISDAARLEKAAKDKYADRVSESFYRTLIDLKPFGEAGGNSTLYLVDKLDITDKHKLLLPVGNYQTINTDILRQQIPDLPAGFMMIGYFGHNRRDITWRTQRLPSDLGNLVAPTTHLYERELDVHVEVSLSDAAAGIPNPASATLLLRNMLNEVRSAVNLLQSA